MNNSIMILAVCLHELQKKLLIGKETNLFVFNLFHQIDQRWVERYEFDLKGFSQRQQNLYGKYG